MPEIPPHNMNFRMKSRFPVCLFGREYHMRIHLPTFTYGDLKIFTDGRPLSREESWTVKGRKSKIGKGYELKYPETTRCYATASTPKANVLIIRVGTPIHWNGNDWTFYKQAMMNATEESLLDQIAIGGKCQDVSWNDEEKGEFKKKQDKSNFSSKDHSQRNLRNN
ncbi:hypothetical protein ABG067_006995 [Albugo candida]